MKSSLVQQIGRNHIPTRSGRFVNLLEPSPEDIIIEDIIWGLCGINRWYGQTEEMIPVALHSLRGLNEVSRENKLEFLLHDAPEYVLGDIVKPVRLLITGYDEIEDRIMKVIASKFMLKYPFPQEVIDADLLMAEKEFEEFKYSMMPPPKNILYNKFLDIFNTLYTERRNKF